MGQSCVSLSKLRAFGDIGVYYVLGAALGELALGTK